MKKNIKWLFILLILSISCQESIKQKEVIGYYQSWNWQNSKNALDPNNIPYDKLTIINYSFFYPLQSGEIIGMDPVADRYLLKAETESKSSDKEAHKSIIELAKNHGTKVVLSIGGWDTSNNFPVVSAFDLSGMRTPSRCRC